MPKFKRLPQRIINDIRYSEKSNGIMFDTYGRTSDISNYSDDELTAMYHGFYRDSKILLTDGEYFLDLTKVTGAYCTLKKVTYVKEPSLEEYKNNLHNVISNIRTFYVRNYFLLTEPFEDHGTEHEITKQLLKAGAYSYGSGNFKYYFRIANSYKIMQKKSQGSFPKDLFYPIKSVINELFFDDGYWIKNFSVKGDISIH